MSETALLSSYKKNEDADALQWLQSYNSQNAQQKPAKESPVKPPEPVEPGGFFNTIAKGPKAIADYLYPAAPVEGAGLPRKTMEGAASTMAEGMVDLPGKVKDLVAPTSEESARRSKLPLAEGAMEFGKHLLGIAGDVVNATPVGGLIGAAGPPSGAVGKAVTADELSDKALQDRIARLQQDEIAGTPEAKASPELGGDIGGGTLPPRVEQIAGLKHLLMTPFDERLKQAEDTFAATGQAMVGVVPFPMLLGAGSAIKSAAGVLSGPAREATATGRAARIEAMRAAGEKIAAERAAQQTAQQAETAKAATPGGPTPPKTLADIHQGMQRDATPGVKAGPSAPGSIPENMMTLDKLQAKQRLAMLQRDPAAREAMDSIPEAKAAATGTQATEAQPSTVHPHEAPAPTEEMSDEMKRIAKEYDSAITDPKSKPAWDKLASETDRMYDGIAKKVKVEKVTGQPYASAEEMNKDIASGHFKVTTDNSEHPFWTEDQNWKFRVVHDYTGHFMGGNDFSLAGETEAFKAHATHLTDPEAKAALQNEIVGQAASYTANGGKFPEQKAFIPQEQVSPSVSVKAYHGTSTTFDEYKGSQFFAERPETANYYANRQALDSGAPAGEAPQIRPVSLRLERPAPEQLFHNAMDMMQGDRPMAEELLKSKGYDGVRFEGADTGKGVHYLAFDAAKQATTFYGEAAAKLPTALEAAQNRIMDRLKEWGQALQGEQGAMQLRGSFAEGWEKNKKFLNDLSIVGSHYLWENPLLSFKDWSTTMVEQYGNQISPQLEKLYKMAREQMSKFKVSAKDMPNFQEMHDAIQKGEPAWPWYDGSKEEFETMFGTNAELFAKVYSAVSPMSQAESSNITLAFKAMDMIMSGEKHEGALFTGADGFIASHRANLNRILQNKPLSGPKVGEFFPAIMGDRDANVVDRWMGRYFNFLKGADDPRSLNDSQVKFIQLAVASGAKEMGIDVRSAQAGLWAVQKALTEGKEVGEVSAPLHELIANYIKKNEIEREWIFPKAVEEALPAWVTEEGKIQVGTFIALGRAGISGVLGAMTGDDPESSIRNGLLAAGIGSFLSPKLARSMAEQLMKPEVLDTLKSALTLKGEQGAINLRFPKKAVGDNPSPNTARMGASSEAKALVRGINEKLSAAGKLDRDTVQTWEQTVADAGRSPYKTVEAVLGLDSAKLTTEELPVAVTAARGVRDQVLEDVLTKVAQAKVTGDPAMAKDAVDHFLLAGRVSEQVTNFQTALARGTGVQRMKSKAAIASKYSLDTLSQDMGEMRQALLDRGKISDTQLVDMISSLGDKAAAAKIAEAGSKWPEALWNIYYGLNLLGSPLTQFRNVIGNMGGLAMAVTDRAMGEMIAAPFHIIGKGENMVQSGETYQLAKGLWQVVGDTFRSAKDAKAVPGGMRSAFLDSYRTGESSFVHGGSKASEMLRTLETAQQDGNGSLPTLIQAMSTLAQKNMRVMGAADEVFKTLSFQAELRALALREAKTTGFEGKYLATEIERLVDSPTKDMLAMAEASAHENTFTKAFSKTDQSWKTVWGLGAGVEQVAQNKFMRAVVSPFFRTPMRIAEYSTVHTPGLNFLAAQFYSDMAAGGVKANMAMAKLATGSAVVGLVGWYAAHGYITGDWPSDPQLKASYERAGWQPKSLYMPFLGKYISYDNFEPLSTLVGTTANVVQMSRDLPDWHIDTLMMAGGISAAKSSISKQWFQGVSDLVDIIEGMRQGDSVEKAAKWMNNRLASYVPASAVFRLITNMSETERKDWKSVSDNENPELREFETLKNVFKSEVPGWASPWKERPAIPNIITGEPLPNENSWFGALSPARISTLKDDKVLREIVALDGAGLPKELPRAIGGNAPPSVFKFPGDEEREVKEGVMMSDKERARLGHILTKEIEDSNGNTLHAALKDVIESDEYADASDGRGQGKATLIAQTFHGFMEQAQAQLLDEYPKLDAAVTHRKLLRSLGKLPISQQDQKPDIIESVMGSR